MTAFPNTTICVHIEIDFLVDLLICTSALDYLFQYDIIDSVMWLKPGSNKTKLNKIMND